MPSRFYDVTIRLELRIWERTQPRAVARALDILARQGFTPAECLSCELSPQRAGELPVNATNEPEGNEPC